MPVTAKASVPESRMTEIHLQVHSVGASICRRIQRLQPVTYSWTLGRNRAFLLEALAPQQSR